MAVANTSGSILAAIQGLGFLLSTQALATTVVRSVYDSLRSIISRLAITFLVFGADATVSLIKCQSLLTHLLYFVDCWHIKCELG